MKVKCMGCGLILEAVMGEGICPECGCFKWVMSLEDSEKLFNKPEEIDNLYMSTVYFMAREWLKQKGYITIEKMGIPENPYLPKDYKKNMEEKGLAFEIFEYFNGKKVQVRKIYLNGHIEGFKGNPCVINHIAPKIIAFKCLLQQMNKDYRDFIEKHLLADLPIDPTELSKLYQSQLERIINIKI
jgi:hypothetical protein